MALANKDSKAGTHYSFVAFVKDVASAHEFEQLFRSDTLTNSYVGTGDIDDAIAWLQKTDRSPQRLLVDISGSERALDELDRLADACEPSVEVFVVGERNDVGLFRNLLARGVMDYLVKPLSAELLRRLTLQQAFDAPRQQGRHGRVIVFHGTRGGVGTTSVAAHLARALGVGGVRRRVVYVDLNVYDGCGSALLGRPGGNALLEVLGNVDRLDQQYLERTLADAGEGLFVLSSEQEYAEHFEPGPGAVAKLLAVLSRHYHYVVVDAYRRGGWLFEEILGHASMVCVVADPSVHSARTLVRLVQAVQSRSNPPTVRCILNHPQPASRSRVHVEDFKAAVDMDIQVQIDYDPKAPSLAENTAADLQRGSEFFRGVESLAAQVTGESQGSVKPSFWQRMRRRGR
ncbi:AAA family ATPase [Castellaniella hirudinis]|uniref:AAA family ATPase n=1 Tax=Castellaniella hirudinis TaxID=1144617 RepID=UPI0039C3A6AA